MVGGGVTAPDDLIPSGESFIRNYLIGKKWLDRWQIPWVDTYWLPDNFGHDSQLPVVLNALGAKGILLPFQLLVFINDIHIN
jgi:alpha-mannosidase